ncbi:Outer membrane cobalamin receptor protein [Chryseobacterium gleum]|uniref:Outer membrane cobalamin receptor protein n=2 Tax=Chryseobacterium gleum TaxID=250 RepID=A0A3S4QXR4_CHRGE|nr:TonB-dependent receptor [Chryseobacterium gleum]EFK37365.1 TonB-linked outer membrane protein, SusC/RagA family [Chryseobacterium gleum ATCC 35910]QQY33124.1 TonB-dependent receptor [Chryseobacterium gleum]VEE09408.1 Outer membrane cobalamin receptor protein [Chryseobacterium gleum]
MYHKINFFKFKKLIPIALIFLVVNHADAKGFTLNHPVFSQVNETISGTVKDQNGSAIEGAKITVVETGDSASTDASGNFTISASIGQTLSISYDGYGEQMIRISGTSISVQLEPKKQSTSIEEVTLVGYGSQKKSDLTGAVSQLKAENFKEGMNISVDNLMQGKIAGVRIVQSSGEPGAGVNVSIRGIGSIRSGSTPLFVVDGVPLSNDAVSATAPNIGLGNAQAKNPLNFLNTSDIESITVLKDASAAAIYGARGSNGVVLVTTKRGKKGEPLFTYDTYLGFSSVIKKLDLMTADEYRSAGINKLYDHGGNTDWQDEIFRNAVSSNHSVSFSKSTETGNYFASISHMDQDGIVLNSGFKRTTARLNAEESFFDNKRLKIKLNLTASDIKETGIPNGGNAGSDSQVIIHALMANPTRSVYDENGNYTNFNMNAHYNPLYLLSVYNDKTNTFRVLGNTEATLRILPGLNYKFNLGIDKTMSERNTTMYPNITDRTPKGMYVQANLDSYNVLLEHYLTYDLSLNKHNFSLLGGFSYQKFKTTGTYFGLKNIANQGAGISPDINPGYSGEAFVPAAGYAQENELQSYFGRVNYNYDKKYLLTASLRADGSTRFGQNNKYGYFPSVAVGWTVSNENFLKDSQIINELKLRGSWGQTGNQEVPNKITQASSSLSPSGGYYLYDNLNLINGVVINRTPNPDLKWEVVEQTNIGADFSLWRNKLYGSLEYYNKVTKDPILNIPSRPLSPTSTVWKNVDAKIVNKGFEFSLGSEIIKTENFTWNVDVNGATVNNVVKDLPVSAIYSGEVSGPGLSGVTANIYKNGYEAGSFYMLNYLGVDANGKYIYEDINGDGRIDQNDRKIFEGAIPNFTFGINSYMRYKKFDFAFSFIGQTGGYLVNNTALDLNINNLASDRNVLKSFYDSGASFTNQPQLSSLYLEKSDFIRLNNVRLGYTFDTSQLKFLRSINLYVSAQNLLTITSYSGYDPLVDTNKQVSGNQSLGIDYTTYPSAKTFILGATVKF